MDLLFKFSGEKSVLEELSDLLRVTQWTSVRFGTRFRILTPPLMFFPYFILPPLLRFLIKMIDGESFIEFNGKIVIHIM